MNIRFLTSLRKLSVISGFLLIPNPTPAEPPQAAITAFTAYSSAVEARLASQHRSRDTFLATTAGTASLERLPSPAVAGALLHHWRATLFVPGASAPAFERLLRDVPAYPRIFAPQVVSSRLVTLGPDHIESTLRIRQHHVITVVLDTASDVTFGRLDPRHGFAVSRSTHVDEIDSTGKPCPDHGFLWAQNTFWTYAERDGGLVLEVESISLSRSLPSGLAWAIRPYVESIPRESLTFTLESAARALHS